MSNTLINYIKQHNRFLKLSIDCFMKCNAFHITCCIDMDRFSTTSKAVILVTIYIVLCLASFPDRISQSGVIDVEISDDQLIYCIVNVNERKIKFQKKKKNAKYLSCMSIKITRNEVTMETRKEVENLIHTKKKAYLESKLTKNFGKHKEIRKSLKSLGLKFECSICNINCLENDKFANIGTAKGFSAYFSNFPENLVSIFPNLSNKYAVLSVAQYYSHLGLTKKFDLLPTKKYYIFKILIDVNILKAAGKFLKTSLKIFEDCAYVLAKAVTDICNLSITLNKFRSHFKLAKVKRIFRKDRKTKV